MNAQDKNASSPACLICGCPNTLLRSEIGSSAVWRCPSCGADFWSSGFSKELFAFAGEDSVDENWTGELLARLEKKGQILSLLDIGCGDGSRLATAFGRGWKCFGVEPSDSALASAKKRIGTRAFLTDSVENLISHAFDAILLVNVLEYCPNPLSLFYTLFARGAIQPQTTVFIRTRNAPSIHSGTSLDEKEPLRSVSFSAEALNQMLVRLRFTRIEISELPRLIEQDDADSLPNQSSEIGNLQHKGIHIAAIASGSDFHSFMKERYVPGTWELAFYEHLPRYLLAANFALQKAILDLGCGTGYGTAMLARSGAASALGLDIDPSTIEWAENTHHEKNLAFCVSSDLGENLASKSFDLITCFEMIEHVTKPEQQATIRSIARLLRKNGILLISTPNPLVTELYGDNPFHLREMTREEFLALISEHFKHVRLHYQFIHAGVLITSETEAISSRARLEFLHATDSRPPAVAFVAVCSNEPLPEIPAINFVDNADLVRSKMRTEEYVNRLQIEHFQEFEAVNAGHVELEQQSKQVQNLSRVLEAKDSQLKMLGEQIERLNLAFHQLKADHEQLKADHEQYKADNEQYKADNQQLKADNEQYKVDHEQLKADHEQLKAADQQLKADNQELRHVLTETATKLQGLEESSLIRLERTITGEPWSLQKWQKLASVCATIGRNQLQTHFPAWSRKRKDPSKTVARVESKSALAYQVKKPRLLTGRRRRPRVLYALANFVTGGTSRLVVDLIERLGDEYDQEVITSFVPSPPAYEGLPVKEFRHLDSPHPVLAYMEQFRPDLMHVHYWGDCDEPWYRQVFLAAHQFGCQIIQNVNTPVAPFDVPVFRNVYVSDYVLETFCPGDPRGLVIYPGSNFELFTRRNPGDVPDDCIGMVYRLEVDKLNERAIEPFIEVVRRRPSTHVLIVGGGKFQEPYMRAVRAAGLEQAFEFTGYVAYHLLPALYRRLSVFVAPVWQESFGQVSPFAMNMGIPVVGYNVGAIGEIIDDWTLVIPPGDSSKLADLIIRLLDNRAERLAIGLNNIKRARHLFSLESMISSYRKLYQEAL
jgi:glycosyltransferase involved in cell wall biosynthesis/2-polyprenyl-3-methyl-5-hydroxy-6-metoxy-1,4-benzoquinol methylase